MAGPGHHGAATAAGTADHGPRLPAAERVRIEGRSAGTWWVEPALIVLVLGRSSSSTWAALQNAHYYAAPYLSPLYSPCLSTDCQHVTLPLFGKLPALPILGVVSPPS